MSGAPGARSLAGLSRTAARRAEFVQFRAGDGAVRYYVLGEYKRIGDPSQAMAPGAVGTTLVQQHAVRADESRMAVCGYIFSALDRLSSEDWENPLTLGTGFLG